MVPGSNPGGPTNKINTYLTLEKNTTELCYTLVHSKKVFYIIFMNLAQSVKTCFKKILNIQGRASRSEYWWFMLFFAFVPVLTMYGLILIVSFLLALLGIENFPIESLTIVIAVLVFAPVVVALTTVSVRRLHDLNKSGWYIAVYYALDAIAIIPGISPTLSNVLIWLSTGFFFYLIVIFMFKGSNKKNKYGSPIKL